MESWITYWRYGDPNRQLPVTKAAVAPETKSPLFPGLPPTETALALTWATTERGRETLAIHLTRAAATALAEGSPDVPGAGCSVWSRWEDSRYDASRVTRFQVRESAGKIEIEIALRIRRAVRVGLPRKTWDTLRAALREGAAAEVAIPLKQGPRRAAYAKIEMVFVRGGTFQMGDVFDGGIEDAAPVHEVTVSDFLLGATPVTQLQWTSLMGSNPSWGQGNHRPVQNVSWHQVQEFIGRLNEATGQKYRLPTEAEWEYAARSAGRLERWAGTSNEEELHRYAWTRVESTRPVGQLKPNGLGLYDMTGNVAEWCQDWYGPYPADPQHDPGGPAEGEHRVIRGAALQEEGQTFYRGKMKPDETDWFVGFRLAADP